MRASLFRLPEFPNSIVHSQYPSRLDALICASSREPERSRSATRPATPSPPRSSSRVTPLDCDRPPNQSGRTPPSPGTLNDLPVAGPLLQPRDVGRSFHDQQKTKPQKYPNKPRPAMTLKIGRAKKTVEEIERRSSRRHTDQKKRNGEYANPHRVDDTQPVAEKTNHKDWKKKQTPISGHHQTSAAKNRKPSYLAMQSKDPFRCPKKNFVLQTSSSQHQTSNCDRHPGFWRRRTLRPSGNPHPSPRPFAHLHWRLRMVPLRPKILF